MTKDVPAGQGGSPLFLVRCTMSGVEVGVRIGHPMNCMCELYAFVHVGVQYRWRTGVSWQ